MNTWPASRTTLLGVVCLVVGLCLFLPFRSINYDLNGIAEAQAMEAGGRELLDHNHLLFRPLVALIQRSFQVAGLYHGSVLPVIQIATAVFSALALSVSLFVFMNTSGSHASTVMATMGMAVSWSFWHFSTDAYYITAGLLFVELAVLCLLCALNLPCPTPWLAVASGVACAFAILVWQANVFILVVLGLGYLILSHSEISKNNQSLLFKMGTTLGITILIVVSVYVAVGTIFFEFRTPHTLLIWLLGHEGSRFPLWGQWSIDRLPALAVTAVSSYIPVWEGLGLRDLIRGHFRLEKLPGQIALIALLALVVMTALLAIHRSREDKQSRRLLLWLVASYAVFVPFLIWWDPFEPKWLIVPNFFFWGIVAVVWDKTDLGSFRGRMATLGALIVLIGMANFSMSIWPNHTKSNGMIERAECVAANLSSRDILLALDWNWSGYVSYLFDRRVVSLVGGSSLASEDRVSSVEHLINHTRMSGGIVVMPDTEAFSLEDLAWLEASTGWTQKQFGQLDLTPAFQCGDLWLERVNGVHTGRKDPSGASSFALWSVKR